MKTLTFKIFGLALFIVLTATSCKKALESITFTKEYDNLTFVIDTTSFVGEINLGEKAIATDILARLEESGFNNNNVKEATLKSIRFECLTENQDFNFIYKLSARISGEFDNALIIADKQLPEFHNLRVIDLELKDFNLKDFFKYNEFIIRFLATTDLPIEVETLVKVTAKFEIKAGI